MSVYNYMSFPLDADNIDFENFPSVARVGTKAPNGELVDALDGKALPLAELYRKGLTVMEFGSYS